MRAKQVLIGLFLSSLLASCGKPSLISYEKRAEAASHLDPKIVKAQNAFGLTLHRHLVQEGNDTNVFLSPTSLSTALAMTYNGSAGNTRQAMAITLGWEEMPLEELNKGYKTMNHLLKQTGRGVELNTANSLWSRKGIRLANPFAQTARNDYEAGVEELDFSSKTAHETVNKWVKKQTKGKIPAILNKPLEPSDSLVLVNAIYFNGSWEDEFSPSSTKVEAFRLSDGSTKKVSMMSRTGTYEYAEEDGYQAIRLPYGEGQMDMLVILPDENSSLPALHERLWSDASRWQKPFKERNGEIQLPSFKLEYEKSMDKALQSMGMAVAYDPARADFPLIAPGFNHVISHVMHKTYLEVNEKGTEAAAVTSVTVKATSAEIPLDPFSMNVDRPFFIAIEDRQTGAWLFIGSIYSP
ncbi:serpin family protein [Cohnella nanjingensis]|uniref:Serpin family protein n=1 Tax=Cohnella nanjingensis TaxID=1387779 RepID=A0A7X0VGU8_9BACL|nr:serpin family protein [Cohnella nanjingensis]MBB6673480.1 serpin family protein [Cohnella nanjingensis]